MRCRKFNMKIEANSCNLNDCEFKESCITKLNIETANSSRIRETKPIEVIKTNEVVPEPKIVSDVVETKNNENISNENKESEIIKEQLDITELKQIQVKRFNAKISPDGVNVSFNGNINLIMTKKIAIALSNILQKRIMDEKNMTNLGEYLGEEKVKELISSEIVNQSKKVYRFDISPIPDENGLLSVALIFSDKSQIEFLISKKFAMSFGATLLNKSRLSEGEE